MIRPCPKCGIFDHTVTYPPTEELPKERTYTYKRESKMRVVSCWTRHDEIVGRRLECPRCGYATRSYEVVAEAGKGRVATFKRFRPEQMGLLM